MLTVVQVEPDLAQHPLDAGVMPLAVMQPRRGQPEPQVRQRVLQAPVDQLQPGPAHLANLRQHQQAVRLLRPEAEAVHPGDLDGIEAGVEDGKAVAAIPPRRFELVAAVFAAPAGRTAADVAAPALAALAAVLTGVGETEDPPFGTTRQRAVVEDIAVEVSKTLVNAQIA